ncbi:MAG: UDP-N-acetylmuramate:L-alanyl-gamma-D-glutamyl-meso-diaminopimelate ligase [Candidatus Tectomicrobia bacterium]|uniref:UDP-N-acetylmuramate--L-alanine ligase n=1 Tax=Tectimicrobiota bacterium TaxID=2528274 RepID=A0A933GKC8_UNCTE|nr:UDP-N-acetylmuramate:L-alanyl-gamma-D-glutamyl-meso-diaminopimelate ligase [Candidatus Tectomicrobia bacterium]
MAGQKRIHLIAVCGTGMGALAGMLKEAGFEVSGSDQNIYPPMSTQLERLGVKLYTGYGAQNLREKPDLVVVGNAISRTNPEVQAMLSQDIPYLSLPQAVTSYFLKDKTPIVIVGTHGKTTTSSLMAWVLESSGLDPSFFIGGIPINFGQNYKLGQGDFMVIEGDEYDTAFFDKGPKFLHYPTKAAILTSIEFDHGDIYPDLEAVRSAFKRFLDLMPQSGFLAAGTDFPLVEALVKEASCQVETYGLNSSADWQAQILKREKEWIHFSCYHNRKKIGEFSWSMPGNHNITNALAVMALSFHLGLEKEQLAHALSTFKGTKRRQEVLERIEGITLIDDFAHHPTAVRATLSALKQHFDHGTLWAIFEPRTNTSRRHFFQKDYVSAFLPADKIIIAQIFNMHQIPEGERFDPDMLVKDLVAAGKEAYYIERADQIIDYLRLHLEPKDLVVIMSNGSFDNIHNRLIKTLKERFSLNPPPLF